MNHVHIWRWDPQTNTVPASLRLLQLKRIRCFPVGLGSKGLGILSILKQISQNYGFETVKLPIGWHQTIMPRNYRKNAPGRTSVVTSTNCVRS